MYCPSAVELPNQPITATVVRIDAGEKTADVDATIGRSSVDITGVPFEAIYDPDDLLSNDEAGD